MVAGLVELTAAPLGQRTAPTTRTTFRLVAAPLTSVTYLEGTPNCAAM